MQSVRAHLHHFIFGLLFCVLTQHAHGQTHGGKEPSHGPAALENARRSYFENALKPFVGHFRVPAQQTPSLVDGVYANNELNFWQRSESGTPYHLAKFDLTNIGRERREIRATSNGSALYELQFTFEKGRLVRSEVTTGRRWRIVESKAVVSGEHAVLFTMKRTYFKRRFGLLGPWIVDDTSTLSRMNSMDFELRLEKVSASPPDLPCDTILKI